MACEAIDLTGDTRDEGTPTARPKVEDLDDDTIEELTAAEFHALTTKVQVVPNNGHELANYAPLQDGGRLVQGDSVELDDDTFLRIIHICRNTLLGYRAEAFTLRGIILKRASHMERMFDKSINELVAIILVPLNDPRPDFTKGLEDRPLTSIRCVREIIFTNESFPSHSLRTLACPETWFRYKKENDQMKRVFNDPVVRDEARLVVRWKAVKQYVVDGKVKIKREAFRRLFPEEADPGYSVSRVDLFRAYQRRLSRRAKKTNISRLSLSPMPSSTRKRSSLFNLDGSDDDVVEVSGPTLKKRRAAVTEEREQIQESLEPCFGKTSAGYSKSTKRHRTTVSEKIEAEPSISKHRSSASVRPRTSTKQAVPGQYSLADLYCGMGGVSEGARKAGLLVKYAVEKELHVAETHQHNHPSCKTFHAMVDEFLRDPKVLPVDVLHSSCPCDYWSLQHTRAGRNDEDNIAASFMVKEAAEKTQCRIMTFEQAPGMVWKTDNKPYWAKWLNIFTTMGFDVEWRFVSLANYGNPHARRRLIVLASCPGQYLPEFPLETHGPGLEPFVTVNRAIADIPPGTSEHNPEEMRQMHELRPRNVPVADGHKMLRRLVDGNGTHALHPSGHRKFTVREGMRLQTFPDTYELIVRGKHGRTPWGQAMAMVGDAVPPAAIEPFFKECIVALARTDEEISSSIATVDAIELDD